MKPGRELDVLVAEHIMGWDNIHYQPGGNIPFGRPDDDYRRDFPKAMHYFKRILPYSTDVAAAWEIEVQIEKAGLQEEYIKALIEIHDLNVMLFDSALEYGGNGIGIPLAIWTLVHSAPDERCYAALKAVGIKEGEENENGAGQRA